MSKVFMSVVALGIALLIGVGIGLGIAQANPDTIDGPVKRVEVTPQSCLTALDLSQELALQGRDFEAIIRANPQVVTRINNAVADCREAAPGE